MIYIITCFDKKSISSCCGSLWRITVAELIRCVELGVTDVSSDEKIMDALYSDAETTSDNIRELMRCSDQRSTVTIDIANLCLRKQIIFERV